jgi:hypothetical protein
MNGIRAELYKYKKRKIYMLAIPLLVIPGLLALNSIFFTDPYAEQGQSLLYWLSIAIFTNGLMYVLPIIFSYVSGSNLSEEIENGFFGTLSQRKCKVTVYQTKVLASIIIAVRLFLLEVAGCITIYYAAYIAGGINLTGEIWGKGYSVEEIGFLLDMVMFFCILIPLIINGISPYIVDKNKLIISFVIIIFMERIIPSGTVFDFIVPWNILRKFSQIETGAGGNDIGKTLFSVGNSILVTLIIGFVFYFIGKRKLCKMNL